MLPTPIPHIPVSSARYRLKFEADPTLQPPARLDWWSGPTTRGLLLGRQPATESVAHRRNVGDTT